MADDADRPLFSGSLPPGGAALQHLHWRKLGGLSSGLRVLERFLGAAGFDRTPWIAVAFGCGIAAWFVLPDQWAWLALLAVCLGIALGGQALMRIDGHFPYTRQTLVVGSLAVVAGCVTVWSKSELVGAPALTQPLVAVVDGRVLERIEQPAEQRVRLLLAIRLPGTDLPQGQAMRVRVNVPVKDGRPGIGAEVGEGALVRLKVRLMPPAPPMLPGSYDFARSAWFAGIAATGSALSDVQVIDAGRGGGGIARVQRQLSSHVRQRLSGTPGAIAAAFASGDRGGIAKADEDAMRDAGLTHLLSISGLHVSAVIAATYAAALRLLALWPWLALRVRLPVVAAGSAAMAGVAYTLLTGAQVPTVRSCIGAVLILLALALGREPLSLRLLAWAALAVMLLWPEAVVGPSFQLSFCAVIAIVSLHNAAPVRAFLSARDEPWWQHGLRRLVMLLLTGVVIELALMPIGLFHFHRAGLYGALANVIAIPLTTFVSMPLIGLALLFDVVGAGGPLWWLAGQSLQLLVSLAHWTAAQPGAVTHLPAMGATSFAVFLAGALWLALWRGRVRLWGLVPALAALVSLAMLRPADILVSGDGQHVGITGAASDRLLVLREGRSTFARDNLTEIAGMAGEVVPLAAWPGARCSADFCAMDLPRGGRTWHLLIGRGHDMVPERELAAACERVDIVISDRWLPRSCQPRMLKADRNLLGQTGGLAIDLANRRISTVAEGQGAHGWWRTAPERPRPVRTGPLPLPPAATAPESAPSGQ